MKLRNDHVIIFGGSGGIGTAIAKRLLQDGAYVTLVSRNVEKLSKQKAAISSDRLFILQGDIADIDHHQELFDHACKMMNGLNAFINCAAVGTGNLGRGYEPWDITPEEWDHASAIDYKAAFFIMRNAINYMLERGIRGNLLCFASNAACMPIFGEYGSAKLSIIEWVKALGQQYGHEGIVINGIAPAATFTPMIARYAHDIDQPYPRHALERFIRVEEIAELAYYLMSDFGEIICGHTVVADAGDYGHILKMNEDGKYYYG